MSLGQVGMHLPWRVGVDKVKTQGMYVYVCVHALMHSCVRVHCELVAEVGTVFAELAVVL